MELLRHFDVVIHYLPWQKTEVSTHSLSLIFMRTPVKPTTTHNTKPTCTAGVCFISLKTCWSLSFWLSISFCLSRCENCCIVVALLFLSAIWRWRKRDLSKHVLCRFLRLARYFGPLLVGHTSIAMRNRVAAFVAEERAIVKSSFSKSYDLRKRLSASLIMLSNLSWNSLAKN